MKLQKVSLVGVLASIGFLTSAAAAPTTATSMLQKRDLIDCGPTNQVSYSAASSLLGAIDSDINSGDDFNLYSGQNNAYQYNGAFLTYCDGGFGNFLQASIAGDYLLEMLNTCWTQQGQDNNVNEMGLYYLYEGNNQVGVLCISNAKNPGGCGC